jgi:hypothetical protein
MKKEEILARLESEHPVAVDGTRLLGNPGWWSFRLGRRNRLIVRWEGGVKEYKEMTHETYNKIIGRGKNSRL